MNYLEKIMQDIEVNKLPFIPENELVKLKNHYVKTLKKYGYQLENTGTEKLADYFALKYSSRTYVQYQPENRGLYLAGNPGTGKTYLMKILSGLFSVQIIQSADITTKYAADGESAFWAWVYDLKFSELIIDDLGAERDAKTYGNAGVNIMTEFIDKRYQLWKDSDIRTHYTTNLTAKSIGEKYGDRITSRLAESCIYISVNGKDYRKQPLNQKSIQDK